MDHEKLITQVNDGRQAQVCLNWLDPILSGLEGNVIANLKSAYRSGKHSEVILATGVASLCTLEDLREVLESKVRISQGAQLEMENRNPSIPSYQSEGITGHGSEY